MNGQAHRLLSVGTYRSGAGRIYHKRAVLDRDART
jgi:hypothetical protein